MTTRQLLMIIISFVFSINAFADSEHQTINNLVGTYKYNRPTKDESDILSDFSHNVVRIRQSQVGELNLEFRVACGSKVIPQEYAIKYFNDSDYLYSLNMLKPGAGLCYTGDDNLKSVFSFYDHRITITFSPAIRTPGFDGSYVLEKISDNPDFRE